MSFVINSLIQFHKISFSRSLIAFEPPCQICAGVTKNLLNENKKSVLFIWFQYHSIIKPHKQHYYINRKNVEEFIYPTSNNLPFLFISHTSALIVLMSLIKIYLLLVCGIRLCRDLADKHRVTSSASETFGNFQQTTGTIFPQ